MDNIEKAEQAVIQAIKDSPSNDAYVSKIFHRASKHVPDRDVRLAYWQLLEHKTIARTPDGLLSMTKDGSEEMFYEELATELIEKERLRQIEEEGYRLDHDKKHGFEVLFNAAEAYYYNDEEKWPWERDYFKPKSMLQNMIRAGALILAAQDTESGGTHLTRYAARLLDRIKKDIGATLVEAEETLIAFRNRKSLNDSV